MPQPKLSQFGGRYVAFLVIPQMLARIASERRSSTSDIMKPHSEIIGPT